jgi:hypothetical protein
LNQLEEIERKKEFYEKELGQDKHGHVGAYARGGQTDEFVDRTESLDEVLIFDGKHPPILRNHPMVRDHDDYLQDQVLELAHYKEVVPYSLNKVPLIWVWANEGKQPYNKLFNVVEL